MCTLCRVFEKGESLRHVSFLALSPTSLPNLQTDKMVLLQKTKRNLLATCLLLSCSGKTASLLHSTKASQCSISLLNAAISRMNAEAILTHKLQREKKSVQLRNLLSKLFCKLSFTEDPHPQCWRNKPCFEPKTR